MSPSDTIHMVVTTDWLTLRGYESLRHHPYGSCGRFALTSLLPWLHRVQPGSAAMPAWWPQAHWVRGELAAEDDGSLHIAALIELYSPGRHDFADGLNAASDARSFAHAVVAATQRAHTAAGDSAAAWQTMPEAARTIKLLEYLSSAAWPTELDHWRGSGPTLQADAHGLFMYADCRGAGAAAERELLSSPPRARGTLQQLQPLWGVVFAAPSFPALQTALRMLLVAASEPGRTVFVTLDAAASVNTMLAEALPHCSGRVFSVLPFEERVRIAKELVEKRFALRRLGAFGGAGVDGSSSLDGGGGSGATSGAGKAAGKYDKLRLEQLKNDDDYDTTKRQLLVAYNGGRIDDAILIGLRGADSLLAHPPGSMPNRLPPQKVLHDLLLGFGDKELEVYSVDKELEGAIVALRRAIPSFWGRRVAKALSIDPKKSIALELLAQAMAATGTWSKAAPDFYQIALLPLREADGDTLLLPCTPPSTLCLAPTPTPTLRSSTRSTSSSFASSPTSA